jgi:MFS family permease
MTDAEPRLGRSAPAGPLAPFRHSVFAMLWLATVLSNIGTWMHDVAAGWLMTSLAPTPLMVALVQTATTLPLFLFALPAGALADILDRRRMLMVVQSVLAVVAAALGLVVLLGPVNPWHLLAFTFVMGIGAALMAPTWQAIVPQLVPRDTLQPAVAMNSIGINISRAIGPALAGVIIAAAGIAWPFLINAVTYLVVATALLRWRPKPGGETRLPPEHLIGAIRAGLRYARNSGPLKATLIRAVGFFVFASAFWALLPLIAREQLAGDATFYGIILGCVGAGAVAGAFTLPPLRKALGPNRLVALGTTGMAVVLAALATFHNQIAAALLGLLAGVSWIAVLTSLNVSAQVALPDWVRARGLSIFVTVFFGSMSLGSLLWGQVANLVGVPVALWIAAAGALAAIPLTWPWKLQLGADLDLAPSMHWPEPVLSRDVEADCGPVLVTVEYRVAPDKRDGFLRAVGTLAAHRRRDGAYDWGIFEDAADDGRFIETFLVASWLEHLHQHERVTNADRILHETVRSHQVIGTPIVTHWLASRSADKGGPS